MLLGIIQLVTKEKNSAYLDGKTRFPIRCIQAEAIFGGGGNIQVTMKVCTNIVEGGEVYFKVDI